MVQTELTKIIDRLDAMRQDDRDDVQVRYFQQEGRQAVKVSYNHVSALYTVENTQRDEAFKFDKIDLVAIEIYEMLMPRRSDLNHKR